MPYYAVPGNQSALSSSYKTCSAVLAGATATRRGKITELYAGATGNPNSTDTYVQIDVSRVSTSTSIAGTAWTPTLCDPADGASVTTSVITLTTEPNNLTANSSLWNNGLNQRNSIRVVFPQESQYLIWPATSGNGLVLRALSNAYTGAFDYGCTFLE